MSTTAIVLLVVGVIVGTLALVAVVAKVVIGRVRASGAAAIDAEFSSGDVICSDGMANFFGLSSLGSAQTRGNGALALSPSRLWFRRFGSSEPLNIPLESIDSVDIVQSHLGKTVGRPLLKVTTNSGDSAAWYVKDASAWAHAIEQQRASDRT